MVNGNANACFLLDLLPKQYNYYMKYLAALLILFFCTLQTFGQQEYFLYLQTENSQPFYTRINNNVFSSTGSGYLILAKIPDSTTSITIGFPKNVYPEQQFNIPVNHKDGGYLIKNFGDKGWGLFNLQTASVIMTLTPPEEKKKPEVNGTRKNDAFSLLLANAVNDSAVLYTVVKPPRPSPPVVIAEKKKDTAIQQTTGMPPEDSIGLVKKTTAQKDSNLLVKDNNRRNDSAKTANATLPRGKQNTAIKNKNAGKDTTAIAKNMQPAAGRPLNKPVVKKDSSLTAKNTAAPKKDSMPAARKFSLFRGKQKAIAAKTDQERKDTIILMNSGKPASGKPIAKNTAKKDSSLVIKKQILQAPEEKRDALMNNRDAVVIEKVPVRDSLARSPDKKDTLAALVSTGDKQPLPEKKDTSFQPPVKRLRPLVNKVAELLTDTSYIAVFVDESKDKFDTIRISIPFNELLAFSQLGKPVGKLPDTVSDKKIKDSIVAETSNKQADSAMAHKPAKDSNIASPLTTLPVSSAVTDSAAIVKKKTDSAVSALTLKNGLRPTGKRADSTAVLPESSADALKKDSVPVTSIKDSLAIAKTATQPLFLNSDCKEIAVDVDIDKLRIKMLVVSTDEDRISLAKKLFKQKCLLVKHVRALSELFKTDEGKYKWLDAVYPFVSDAGNFSALGELIKDEYYLNRFKAMLRH
jgi:hypothetical protein